MCVYVCVYVYVSCMCVVCVHVYMCVVVVCVCVWCGYGVVCMWVVNKQASYLHNSCCNVMAIVKLMVGSN